MESSSIEHRHDAPAARDGITVDLISLLSKIDVATGGEGHTMNEICDLLGCGNAKARRIVKAAIEQGKCRASRKHIETITGALQSYPSYVFEGVDE